MFRVRGYVVICGEEEVEERGDNGSFRGEFSDIGSVVVVMLICCGRVIVVRFRGKWNKYGGFRGGIGRRWLR